MHLVLLTSGRKRGGGGGGREGGRRVCDFCHVDHGKSKKSAQSAGGCRDREGMN